VDRRPRGLGEHNWEIQTLGYGDADIQALADQKVI
jgi:hypothetical protein